MKRISKNAIMILLIISLVLLIILTIQDAQKSPKDFREIDRKEMGDTLPEKPLEEPDKDMSSDMQSQLGLPPDAPTDNSKPDEQMPNHEGNPKEDFKYKELSTSYYIVFVIEGSMLAILILYLIISQFNKKSFLEVFSKKKKEEPKL